MRDVETQNVNIAFHIRRLVVEADEKIAPLTDNAISMGELNERFMREIESDDSSNVIGRSRMHQRLRDVALATNGRETKEPPDNIIEFRPRKEHA